MEKEKRSLGNVLKKTYVTFFAALLAACSVIAYSCSQSVKADADVLPPCEITASLDSLFTPLYGTRANVRG